MHPAVFAQHDFVEPHLRRFALVVELLTKALRELLENLLVLDRTVHPVIDRHRQSKLADVGLHRARHVRVLQLAGDLRAVRQTTPMHLPERGGRGGFLAELGEFGAPVWAEFIGHAAAHEGPAHRRRVGLQLGEFSRVFGGQGIRHGGQELRHLHQWALQPAENGFQVLGVGGTIRAHSEHASTGDPRRDAAYRARRARHPPEFAE